MTGRDLGTFQQTADNLRTKMTDFGLAFDFLHQREVYDAFNRVNSRIRHAL